MTLGELKHDLKKLGIRAVGTLRNSPTEGPVVVYFSSDPSPAFPHKLKNIYPLVVRSSDDEEHVNAEKIKALKRTLIPGWQDPDW